MLTLPCLSAAETVAPYAGAWIEICGISDMIRMTSVAPYAGAWIEIHPEFVETFIFVGRSLRGGVD